MQHALVQRYAETDVASMNGNNDAGNLAAALRSCIQCQATNGK